MNEGKRITTFYYSGNQYQRAIISANCPLAGVGFEGLQRLQQLLGSLLADTVPDAFERRLARGRHQRHGPRRHLFIYRPGFFRGRNAYRAGDLG